MNLVFKYKKPVDSDIHTPYLDIILSSPLEIKNMELVALS